MAEEVELKLALPSAAHRALLRHPLLRGAERTRQALDNIYYDTPELALQKRGIALRLRRQGRLWLQTVKCAGQSAGGLSSRPEWETAYAGRFNFTAIDDHELRKWLRRPAIVGRLAAVFETRFSRTTWRLTADEESSTVLVMLDRGWIVAGGRREEISELEIERVTGDATKLLTLASALAERLPLVPSVRSKAERGYRLYAGIALAPTKAGTIAISAGMAPLVAFRTIAHGCLEHLQLNFAGAVERDDPEFIHQMRVACRRLRAALRLFAPVLPEAFEERWLPGLRTLMSRLGRLRDLDVLTVDIIDPVQRGLPEDPRLAMLAARVTERRLMARSDAMNLLQAADYRLLLLALMGALQEPPFAGGVIDRGDAQASFAHFARKRLQRLHAKTIALTQVAGGDDPASLHRLRIAVKRLRYGLEFFAPTMPAKSLRQLSAQLTKLQDDLGQLNDLANGGTVLTQCAGEDGKLREAVALIGGWHARRREEILQEVDVQLRQLLHSRLPQIDV